MSTLGGQDVGVMRPYHHGDLRAALLREGLQQARAGGPAAVQLRDAARRSGVSHNAGYRHFAHREDYLDAVAARAMAQLAGAMERALAQVPAHLPPAQAAPARLVAIGGAYLRFALDEPGWFRTAFATRTSPGEHEHEDARGPGGADPYELLERAVDDLAAAGLLPPERRPHSELVAWTAVHGLSELLLDGPLRGSGPEEVEAMWQRVSEGVLRGM